MLSRFKLYRIIRRHRRLASRRSPSLEQNVWAKVFMALGAGFFVFYLLLYGVLMGMAVERGEYSTIIGFMPFVLTIDFLLRFLVQQTPDMLVKPYLLVPMRKLTVIECFLLSSLMSGYNWLWLALFLPYAVIALAAGCTLAGVLMTALSFILLMMLNSQVYLLLRTFIGRNVLWWIMAIAVYACLFLPWILSPDYRGFDRQFYLYVDAGSSWLFPLVVAVLLFGLLWLNRSLQFRFVYEEIAKQEQTSRVRTVSSLNFLGRFGDIGEYLKLEVKSVMRNKAMRSRFWMSMSLIVMLTLLIAYTSAYDGTAMTNFWCFYCFGLYGVMSLTKVMGPEGNYIDLLMTHKENILLLLKAKYLFHCFILFVPFLLMLPAVIEGKFSLLMMVAYMLLCSGLLYFIMFQLAVYNKQTLPLEQKLTGKGNFENGLQLLIEMAGFVAPILLVYILHLLFSEETAFIVQALIGLVLTLTSPFWLRNIYRRMMVRRYENLEGFVATRC